MSLIDSHQQPSLPEYHLGHTLIAWAVVGLTYSALFFWTHSGYQLGLEVFTTICFVVCVAIGFTIYRYAVRETFNRARFTMAAVAMGLVPLLAWWRSLVTWHWVLLVAAFIVGHLLDRRAHRLSRRSADSTSAL